MNISKHPLIKQVYELCLAIEKLPASPEETNAVTLASSVGVSIEKFVDRCKAVQWKIEELAKNAAAEQSQHAEKDALYWKGQETAFIKAKFLLEGLLLNGVPTPTAAQKYRKRPVVVEAIQFNPDPRTYDRLQFHETIGFMFLQYPICADVDGPYITISTLEGKMRVNPGDWIITGIEGENYPCKDEIFRKTYEAIQCS